MNTKEAYARGGLAKQSPSGRLYVCEQCRLDTSDGAGAKLTQAVATVELTRGDTCDWCDAPLLQEQADAE